MSMRKEVHVTHMRLEVKIFLKFHKIEKLIIFHIFTNLKLH